MTTIDEMGRRAAATLLADAARTADATEGLERIRSAVAITHRESRRLPARMWIALASAAAIVTAVAGGAIVNHRPARRNVTVVPALPTESTPATTPAPTPPTSPPTVPATTVAPTPIGVSYLDPPPLFEPVPFASLQLAQPSESTSQPNVMSGEVAVTPTGFVVVDRNAPTALVLDQSGTVIDTVTLDVDLGSIVAGPANVLYGLHQGPQPLDPSIVAIALSGPSRGSVIASSPVDIVTYVEIPVGAFGHGPTGIVDRVRDVGHELIRYVDETGQPLTVDGSALVTIDAQSTVRMERGPTWPLVVQRDPTWSPPLTGRSPPAQAPNGGAVFWTEIGPPVDPHMVYPDHTLPVVASLYADGTGHWWRLPQGWSVAASDQWGTVLGHATETAFELARLPDRT